MTHPGPWPAPDSGEPQQQQPPAAWGTPPTGPGWSAPTGWGDPGWPAAPPPPGRNGFAVAGLVLGILPVFAGVLGIVFGLIGRSQTRRTGQKGETMATVGAVLGACWLLLVIGAGVWSVATTAERSADGTVVESGDESAFSLEVGDCLRDAAEGVELSEVPLVPCDQPHDGEVYASFELPDGEYPGDDAVFTAAEEGCVARFADFVGVAYEDSVQELIYLHPTRRSWALADDREVVCLIVGDDAVGSARGSRR